MLLVFDDLEQGDDLSLLLLEFVAGELAVMHVAIVATYAESPGMPDALRHSPIIRPITACVCNRWASTMLRGSSS